MLNFSPAVAFRVADSSFLRGDIDGMMASARSGHFPPLDGLRGAAILCVLLVHGFDYRGPLAWGRAIHAVAAGGWVGVTLFFVLSGFLITGILLDTKGQRFALRDFLARRGLRIFPLYFAFLAVYFFVVPAVPTLAARLSQPTAAAKPFYWLYLSNMIEYVLGTGQGATALSPLWSLAVEEQVYLVWPFLILFLPDRRLPWVLGFLGGLSAAFRVYSLAEHFSVGATYGWSISNLEAFAAGGLVAWASRRPWGGRFLTTWAPRGTIAALAVLIGLIVRLGGFSFWMHPIALLTIGISAATLFFASVIAVCVTSSDEAGINRFLSIGVLRSLGRYSYAIYLFHEPVNEVMRSRLASALGGESGEPTVAGAFVRLIVAASVTYGLAWVTWRVWERPILELKRFFPRQGRVVRLAPESRDL